MLLDCKLKLNPEGIVDISHARYTPYREWGEARRMHDRRAWLKFSGLQCSA